MKKCFGCEVLKPQSDFAKKSNSKDGLQARCRDCHSAYTRSHYAGNKSYYREKATKARDEITAMIRKAKDKPCTDCGLSFPYYVMDFDHLTDKSFNISEAKRLTGKRVIEAEIAKCELVCANCHRARTHFRQQN